MSYDRRKSAAEKMLFRPNPCTTFHNRLSYRYVLHTDIMAYEHNGSILFEQTQRAGGRGEPVSKLYYSVPIGSMDHPIDCLVDERTARHVDRSAPTGIKFNTRSGLAWYDWAMAYHHERMRPWVMDHDWRPLKQRARFTYANVLFHYFHVFDVPAFPPNFVNQYVTHGKGPHRVTETSDYPKKGIDSMRKAVIGTSD